MIEAQDYYHGVGLNIEYTVLLSNNCLVLKALATP